jgi:nitroreductase
MNETIKHILTRQSCREFIKKRISNKTIETLFDCAKKAPRSQGNEFIEFYFIRNKKIIEQISWFCPGMEEVPELIVILGIKQKRIDVSESYYHYLELGASLQNILLSASSLGIGSVPVGSSNFAGIHSLLGLSKEISLKILISLGYPTNNRKIKVNLSQYNKTRSYNLL